MPWHLCTNTIGKPKYIYSIHRCKLDYKRANIYYGLVFGLKTSSTLFLYWNWLSIYVHFDIWNKELIRIFKGSPHTHFSNYQSNTNFKKWPNHMQTLWKSIFEVPKNCIDTYVSIYSNIKIKEKVWSNEKKLLQ